MNFKIFLIFLILLSLISINFAYTDADLLWNGYLNVELNNNTFVAGEEISGEIILTNEEYYPIVSNTIILQLASGEYGYPSQFYNENIFYEKIIDKVWVLPRATKRIEFSINAPSSGGKHHISIYSWNQKSMFVGADSIQYGAQIKNFEVIGEKIENSVIVRNITGFGKINEIGPVGFPVKPNETFPSKIFVENKSNVSKNLELELLICDWSCAISESIFTKEKNIGILNSGERKEINIDLIAPEIPSAYEIKIILKENEKIESIYSNRVIVEGGTAKIRKIILDGLKNQEYSIKTILLGSPDHFTYPDFENFELKLEVFNNNSLIETNNEKFDIIKTGPSAEIKIDEYKESIFILDSKIFDKICLKVVKENVLFEEECFDVPLEELVKAEQIRNPKTINTEWQYNSIGKRLNISLIKEGYPINSRITVTDLSKSFVSERVEQSQSYYNNSFFIEPGKYYLTVFDFDAKRQETIELLLGIDDSFIVKGSEVIDHSMLPCQGLICEIGTVCDSITIKSSDGDCCLTQCIPKEQSIGFLEEMIPLILWFAIIILIGSIIFFKGSINKIKVRK
jgi:hypothetical protein